MLKFTIVNLLEPHGREMMVGFDVLLRKFIIVMSL